MGCKFVAERKHNVYLAAKQPRTYCIELTWVQRLGQRKSCVLGWCQNEQVRQNHQYQFERLSSVILVW